MELWNDVVRLGALEELLHDEYKVQLRFAREIGGNFGPAENIFKHLTRVRTAIKRLEDRAVAPKAA